MHLDRTLLNVKHLYKQSLSPVCPLRSQHTLKQHCMHLQGVLNLFCYRYMPETLSTLGELGGLGRIFIGGGGGG